MRVEKARDQVRPFILQLSFSSQEVNYKELGKEFLDSCYLDFFFPAKRDFKPLGFFFFAQDVFLN